MAYTHTPCCFTPTPTTAPAISPNFPAPSTTSFRRRHAINQRVSATKPPLSSKIASNFSYQTKAIKFKTRADNSDVELEIASSPDEIDCVGTGIDVECIVSEEASNEFGELKTLSFLELVFEWGLLISPFFFWGTAMVAMKEVLPKTGPFFVAAFRLVPAGLLLVGFARSRGRSFPSGFNAWLAISLFGLVDASCFQGFLAEGLERTSAGLGSVIIDSQPLTVAVLASLLFGESIGLVGAAGLILGVVGLLLLELPALSLDEGNFSLWGSGEWWMLLAAQSMAVGTVMVRWVSKFSDPIMATGWSSQVSWRLIKAPILYTSRPGTPKRTPKGILALSKDLTSDSTDGTGTTLFYAPLSPYLNTEASTLRAN